MKAKQNQLSISLIILLLWAAIVVIGNWLITGGISSLADLVKDRQNLVYFIVPFLLYGVVTFLKWKQPVGLRAAKPFHSWLLLWLPVLYALGYLAFAFNLGLPSILVMFFVLLNSVRVGIEEELMFRGILFYGMLSRFNIWPAIWVTTLLYGSVHLLNGFLTGNFSAALFQALQAALIGLMLMAIRLRTKSVYPAMVTHGLYNFAVFTLGIAAGSAPGPTQNVAEPPLLPRFLPSVIIPLSLFVYGLWLLRGIGKQSRGEPF